MSLTEDLMDLDGTLDGHGACRECNRLLTRGERRHNGFLCHGCNSRHRRQRGQVPDLKRPKAAEVPIRPLGVGCRVKVGCFPPVEGAVIRPERERWIVDVDGWGEMPFWPSELRPLASGDQRVRVGRGEGEA